MDATVAIEWNREALKRILAMLVGMAGLGGGASTLPRRLYRAILRLLRPAESATRRLIIAAAYGIVVTLPRPGKPKQKPAIRLGSHAFKPTKPKKRAKPDPRVLSLPLLDPLKRPFRIRRRYTPAHATPRITVLDFHAERHPLPAPPSPDDPIDATRLMRRLDALAAALNDLPGQARRFSRWKAHNDAALASDKEARAVTTRFRRISPLRRGRPPGGRLSRYDPSATHPRRIREIDEILAHAHALAEYALKYSDTS
jgi:hypothetical protein